jgi:RNA polymerase sigma factor (sigma-70 family)
LSSRYRCKPTARVGKYPSLFNVMLSEAIEVSLAKLTFREREILKLRFGLDGSNTYTLEEVGKRFKINRERVRQIQLEAIDKLKPVLADFVG